MYIMIFFHSDIIVGINFLNIYGKIKKYKKFFIPYFFIPEKNEIFFKIQNDFALKSIKKLIKWEVKIGLVMENSIFPNYFFYQSKNIYCRPEFEKKLGIIKKKSDYKIFNSICKFIRLIIYSVLMKKTKIRSTKKLNKDYLNPLFFYCLDSTIFVNKFMPKISNATILGKLKRDGIVKIIYKKSNNVRTFLQLRSKFQLYSKKLKIFFFLSKFVHFQ